jgi:hypothetical protein
MSSKSMASSNSTIVVVIVKKKQGITLEPRLANCYAI